MDFITLSIALMGPLSTPDANPSTSMQVAPAIMENLQPQSMVKTFKSAARHVRRGFESVELFLKTSLRVAGFVLGVEKARVRQINVWGARSVEEEGEIKRQCNLFPGQRVLLAEIFAATVDINQQTDSSAGWRVVLFAPGDLDNEEIIWIELSIIHLKP